MREDNKMHGDLAAVEAVKRIRVSLLHRDPGLSADKAREGVYDGHGLLKLCNDALPSEGTCSLCALSHLPIILYLLENGYAFAGMAMPSGSYPWTRQDTLVLLKQVEFLPGKIDDIVSKIVRPAWLVDAELPEQLR